MSDQQDSQNIDDELLEQILEQFIPEAREVIDHLNLCLIQLDQDFSDEALLETVKRGFHTLKGSSGFAGLNQLSTIAKAFEMLMADVKKGNLSLTASAVNLMYEGLDAIAAIIEKAEAKDYSEIDGQPLVEKVEKLKAGQEVEAETKTADQSAPPSKEFDELLNIYRDGYNQLAVLKHLMFSSIHLSDPETLAAILSKQIHERLGPVRNSLWLIDPDEKIIEIAKDGELLDTEQRRVLQSDYSEVLQRILHEQLIIWPDDSGTLKGELPEYQSAVIFPIKMKTAVLGLLVIDPEEKAELELYQFITQFAAMMLSIAKLHQKVAEQRSSLDEMAGILFKQNAHLSALHHVELELMNEKEPVKLCDIVVRALVAELDAVRAAAFLYDPSSKEFICAAQNGGFKEIVGKRFALDAIGALQQGMETGRLIAHIDYGETLSIGPNQLENWIALGIKGHKKSHGMMVVEIGEEEVSDAISVVTNHLGAILDNVLKEQRSQKT